MKLPWAIVGGLLLGGGLAWWLAPDRPSAPPAAPAGTDRADPGAPGVVYRWRDARGVTQITREPPQGHAWERIEIDPERNILPLAPDRD